MMIELVVLEGDGLLADTTARTLSNGLTVIVEAMPTVQSAAYSLLVPAGSAYDPPGQSGRASALCDWLTRGAAGRSNREFATLIDQHGIQHSESVSAAHLSFSGTCLAEHLPRD